MLYISINAASSVANRLPNVLKTKCLARVKDVLRYKPVDRHYELRVSCGEVKLREIFIWLQFDTWCTVMSDSIWV